MTTRTSGPLNSGADLLEPLASGLERDGDPIWSPDGRRIAFASEREGGGIFVRAVDGAGDVERLTTGTHIPASWSPDGTRLVYADFGTESISSTGPTDLSVVFLTGDRRSEKLLATPVREGNGGDFSKGAVACVRIERDGREGHLGAAVSGRLEKSMASLEHRRCEPDMGERRARALLSQRASLHGCRGARRDARRMGGTGKALRRFILVPRGSDDVRRGAGWTIPDGEGRKRQLRAAGTKEADRRPELQLLLIPLFHLAGVVLHADASGLNLIE